jgi:hypothetical protein
MSDSNSRLLAAADVSSWDSLGHGTLPTSRSSQRRRGGVTGHIFQGLATLLIVSLCILLVELQTPGILNHVGHKLSTYWQWIPDSKVDKDSTIAISSKSYYAPVPAPFLSNRLGVPSQEATTIIGTKEFLEILPAPTSEPTGD